VTAGDTRPDRGIRVFKAWVAREARRLRATGPCWSCGRVPASLRIAFRSDGTEQQAEVVCGACGAPWAIYGTARGQVPLPGLFGGAPQA
jgi:hypothetical protein